MEAAAAGAPWAQAEVEAGPKLNETSLFYLECFHTLSTERPIGFVEGAIPNSAIIAEAERLGLDLVETDVFEYVLRAVDASYIKRQTAKQKKSRNQGN